MRVVSMVVLVSFVCACRSIPTAPSQAEEDPEFSKPTAVVLPGLASDPAPDETLMAGDVVSVHTVSVSPIDVPDLVVDAAGSLHVPVAGAVKVAGLTLEAATQAVAEKLHRYDERAQVHLHLANPTGHRATVAGTVATPGVFALTPGMRLSELLLKAGGPLHQISEGEEVDLADLEGARLVRNGVALPVSIVKAMEGDLKHNVLVHPSDMLVVPAARGQRVSVLGYVKTPRVIPFRSGLRLSDALTMAGGVATWESDTSDIRIIRGSFAHPKLYRASFRDTRNGSAPDALLEAGDVVF
ncbi:MAG: SLBB domain-containing protein, partial [Deltaproteobacteria bacterium]|nr:SLBB domain-containing protein [Deltaproteobacteria bacterium]